MSKFVHCYGRSASTGYHRRSTCGEQNLGA